MLFAPHELGSLARNNKVARLTSHIFPRDEKSKQERRHDFQFFFTELKQMSLGSLSYLCFEQGAAGLKDGDIPDLISGLHAVLALSITLLLCSHGVIIHYIYFPRRVRFAIER